MWISLDLEAAVPAETEMGLEWAEDALARLCQALGIEFPVRLQVPFGSAAASVSAMGRRGCVVIHSWPERAMFTLDLLLDATTGDALLGRIRAHLEQERRYGIVRADARAVAGALCAPGGR
jgi:hypothetical protein